jgi:hypothetical protein
MFPSLAASMAKSGESGSLGKGNAKSAAGDVYSLAGRAIGSGIDKLRGRPFLPNLGVSGNHYIDSAGNRRQRGGIDAFLQGIGRDEMLIPSIALGGAAGAGLRGLGAAKLASGGLARRTAVNNIGVPLIEGAATGAASEALRPFVASKEFSKDEYAGDMLHGGIMGAGLNLGLKNALGLAKFGLNKGFNRFKDFRRSQNEKGAIIEDAAKNEGKPIEGIVEERIADNKALAKRVEENGITLDDLYTMEHPKKQGKPIEGQDFWDMMIARDNVNHTSQFNNAPLEYKLEEIARRANLNANSLKSTLTPEGVASMRDLHGEGGLNISKRHLQELVDTEFKRGTDAKDIFMQEHSGDLVNPQAVRELGEYMRGFGSRNTTGGTLSSHHRPASSIMDEYAAKLLNPDGTPKEITLREWEQIRNEFGGRKSDFDGQLNLDRISKEGKRDLDRVYDAFRQESFDMLSPEAQAAHAKRAEFKRTHDDVIDNMAKNNIDTAPINYGTKIANLASETPVKKAQYMEWLRNSDALRGTNFANEAANYSHAQNIMGGAAKEVPFGFMDINLHRTGRALDPNSLTVRQAVALANYYAQEAAAKAPRSGGRNGAMPLAISGGVPRLPQPGGGAMPLSISSMPKEPKPGGSGGAMPPSLAVLGKGGMVLSKPMARGKKWNSLQDLLLYGNPGKEQN